MKPKEITNAIMLRGAAVLTGAAGFSQAQWNFHRRLGSVTQVVNFQRTEMSVGGDMFYVNVGIAFDALSKHLDIPIAQKPSTSDCHFQSRLESLVTDSPQWWGAAGDGPMSLFLKQMSHAGGREIASSDKDVDRVVSYFETCIRQALIELDQIDKPEAFLNHRWKEVPGTDMLVPMLAYVTGDYDQAWSAVEKASKKFSDRDGMSPAEIINRLRLEKLTNRLPTGK